NSAAVFVVEEVVVVSAPDCSCDTLSVIDSRIFSPGGKDTDTARTPSSHQRIEASYFETAARADTEKSRRGLLPVSSTENHASEYSVEGLYCHFRRVSETSAEDFCCWPTGE